METLAILYLRHRTALFSACGILGTLAIAGTTWWQILNVSPALRQFPVSVMPSPNARDYFIKASSQQIVDGHGTEIDDAPRGPLAALSNRIALLKDNAPAIATLRQGFHYSYRMPPERGFKEVGRSIPDFGKFRKDARLLNFAGHIAEDRNQWNEAAQYYLDAIQLGMEVPRGGGTSPLFTGVIIEDIGRVRMWKVVDHLNAKEARSATQRLEALNSQRIPLADLLMEDKWQNESSLQDLFQQNSTFSLAHQFIPGPNPFHPDAPEPTFWDYLRYDSQLLLKSKRHLYTDIDRSFNSCIERSRQANYDPYWKTTISHDLISETFASPVILAPKIDKRDRAAQTQNTLLLIKLALHVYYCEQGMYPPDLSSLVTIGYLSHVPSDKFSPTNEPPHFQRLSPHKYQLYSVGPDGKDNGGKPICYTTGKNIGKPQHYIDLNGTGDFVVGVNVQ